MIKIKRNKPVISRKARPNRDLRRLNANPTYIPINPGETINHICLASISATTAMSGVTLGVVLRLIGF
jgi:hypothetical protein